MLHRRLRQPSSSWLPLAIFIIFASVMMTQQVSSHQPSHLRPPRHRPRPILTKQNRGQPQRVQRSEKPNIVFIITDDQDSELGSLNFMPKLTRYLRDAGATFPNAFVTTPMCCPSRSSMLTGMYVHNHNTYTNNDNCSSPQWRQTHETKNFGTFLHDAGYRTGYFGKYLNDYLGAYIPPGWTEWMGLIRNTRFYNYTINHNMTKIKHEDDYHKDYLTDLIANKSVNFFRESKQSFPQRPVAMVLSMPAPHGPEDAAPQYQNKFFDVRTHRTPSWNFAPNPDKQWLLQFTQKMSPIQIAFTDLLHIKRLQTLQSVDDAVEKVYEMLKDIGELDNTYIIYTSDHGYHLGQYGLVKGKAMPYEFDIKVPFLMRGPNIPANVRIPNVVLNLDLAPTMLDIAGVPVPEHMDGSSIMKLFDGTETIKSEEILKKRVWRDTFLVERGKLTQRKLKVQEKLEAQYNRLVQSKEQLLEDECRKPQYQPPCTADQVWECRRTENGKLRIFKCRHNEVSTEQTSHLSSHCRCPPKTNHKVHMSEKKRQLSFLKKNVNQPTMIQPRFINGPQRRGKRHIRRSIVQNATTTSALPLLEVEEDQDSLIHLLSDSWTPVDFGDDISVPCRVSINDSVSCERYVYTNMRQWEIQRNKIEKVIKAHKDRITQLKDIRKHLLDSRPTDAPSLALEHRGRTVAIDDDLFDVTDDDRSVTTTAYNILSAVELTVENDLEDERNSEKAEVTREEEDEEDEEAEGVVTTSEEETDEEEEDECVCDANGNRRVKNRKLESLARRIEKQDERGQQRRLRMEKHRATKFESGAYLRKKHKRNRSGGEQIDPTEKATECNAANGWCHRDLSTAAPLDSGLPRQVNWDSIDFSQYSSRNDPNCHVDGLECSRMDNDHWKVAPFWTKGPFCFCPNSNNNTYWCLRTVNDSHNFLYCEFITGFISFYDMTKDPYQLRNAVHDLNYDVLHQLHNTLEKMKGCKGSRKCNLRSRPHEDERSEWKQVRHNGRHGKLNHQYSDTAAASSRSIRVSLKRG